jgi:putative hydrolase of the HAD superfamily
MRDVIFDLGGVFIEWKPADILARLYPDEADRSLVGDATFRHGDWSELDRGMLSEEVAIQRFAERTGRSVSELAAFMDFVRESLVVVPQTVALIEELAARGMPLYCLSNISEPNFAFLRKRYDFWPAFRGIVISGSVKMIKPDSRIFQVIADRFELVPGKSIYVDDLAANVESAGRLGFRAIQFKTAQQCRAQIETLLGAT